MSGHGLVPRSAIQMRKGWKLCQHLSMQGATQTALKSSRCTQLLEAPSIRQQDRAHSCQFLLPRNEKKLPHASGRTFGAMLMYVDLTWAIRTNGVRLHPACTACMCARNLAKKRLHPGPSSWPAKDLFQGLLGDHRGHRPEPLPKFQPALTGRRGHRTQRC